MFFRLQRHAEMFRFRIRTRDVFKTSPLRCESDTGVIFVSQVCHRDIAMYLIAIKSLAKFIPPKKVFVLDDLSLNNDDKATLHAHIHRLDIVPVNEIRSDACPRGGTWERLLFISALVDTSYVIQVDSDTLTRRQPKVVERHIRQNSSFALGEWPGQSISTVQKSVELVRHRTKNGTEHVQFVAEANLDKLHNYDRLRYVRGCSGFAGFGHRSFSRESVEKFSEQMASIVGREKWNEWGSEQVTSNFIVANSDKGQVLPFPEYCFHAPGTDMESATFVHFIGSYRFHGGHYARLAGQVISELQTN
jgi:hypothetical protein